MIDILALGIVHVLLSLAAWRLVNSPSLDKEQLGDKNAHGRDE